MIPRPVISDSHTFPSIESDFYTWGFSQIFPLCISPFSTLTLKMKASLSYETSGTARPARQSLNSEDIFQHHRWNYFNPVIIRVNVQFCCPVPLRFGCELYVYVHQKVCRWALCFLRRFQSYMGPVDETKLRTSSVLFVENSTFMRSNEMQQYADVYLLTPWSRVLLEKLTSKLWS